MGRLPLLPKELIVPVCMRFGILLVMMCCGAITIHFMMLWKQGKLNKDNGLDGTIMNATSSSKSSKRFFLDIGPIQESQSLLTSMATYTKQLEAKGWHGVCADPFPHKEHNNRRSCSLLTFPVGAATGEKVRLVDWRACEGRNFVSKALFSCPEAERTVVSISDVLRMSKAPRIIDFIHLDNVVTAGNQVEVLQSFPFDNFCARSWAVKDQTTAVSMLAIRETFKARRCRVKETEVQGTVMYSARCPCAKVASLADSSHNQTALEAPHAMKQSKAPRVMEQAKAAQALPQLMRSAQGARAVQKHESQSLQQQQQQTTGVAQGATQGKKQSGIWIGAKGGTKGVAQRTPWRKRAVERAAQRTAR